MQAFDNKLSKPFSKLPISETDQYYFFKYFQIMWLLFDNGKYLVNSCSRECVTIVLEMLKSLKSISEKKKIYSLLTLTTTTKNVMCGI